MHAIRLSKCGTAAHQRRPSTGSPRRAFVRLGGSLCTYGWNTPHRACQVPRAHAHTAASTRSVTCVFLFIVYLCASSVRVYLYTPSPALSVCP
jgi:hypothetical protein